MAIVYSSGFLAVAATAFSLLGTVPGPTSRLTVAASSDRAGTHPVRLTLSFRTELQCGNPFGLWRVTLPAAEHVPAAIGPARVTVNGRLAVKVGVIANRVTVTVARPQVLCDVIAPGKVTFVFMPAAGLGNPKHSGRYPITVERASVAARGILTIR